MVDDNQTTDNSPTIEPSLRTSPNPDAETSPLESEAEKEVTATTRERISSRLTDIRTFISAARSELPDSLFRISLVGIIYLTVLIVTGWLFTPYQPVGILSITTGGISYFVTKRRTSLNATLSDSAAIKIQFLAALFVLTGIGFLGHGIIYAEFVLPA